MAKPVSAPPASRSLRRSSLLPLALIALALVVQSYRVLRLIAEKAVNILYWDMWDYNEPIFHQSGLLAGFFKQFGPHRQGAGGVLIQLLVDASGWNSNAEVYAIFILLLLAALASLWIKRLIFGRWDYFDALIPLLFINPSQYEIYIASPNIALASFPVLLVVMLVLAWFVPRSALRYTLVALLTFLLIFTGFGIFGGAVATGLLLLESVLAWRRDRRSALYPLVALGFVLAGWGLFFYGYIFGVTSCPLPVLSEIPRVPAFAALMYARYFRLSFLLGDSILTKLAGAGLLAAVMLVTVVSAWRFLARRQSIQLDRSLLVLAGYSLVFGLYAALGRYCLGSEFAYAGRYMPFHAPAVLGIYLFILALPWPGPRWASLTLFLLLVVALALPLQPKEQSSIDYYAEGKRSWQRCYLELRDAPRCDEQTGFTVYSNEIPRKYERFQQRLDYLEQNHLNLFRDP